jgi:hypothetical protein
MGNSQEAAELEALQADVMRFVAILGLCLAAIFSLVHSAAVEQTAAQSPPVEAEPRLAAETVSPAIEPEPPEKTFISVPKESAPVQLPVEVQPQNDPAGFTLEFASVKALQFLLQNGQVQLYASFEGQFWSTDTWGNFTKTGAPASYYHMQSDTVPRRLRDSLPEAVIAGTTVWGVTLSAGTVKQIQQLTTSREGGNLVIGQDGAVNLDD